MPKADLISKQCQQLSELINVLITSYNFHNIAFTSEFVFAIKSYHFSSQWLVLSALCGVILKELKNLQDEKGKIVEIKHVKWFYFALSYQQLLMKTTLFYQ